MHLLHRAGYQKLTTGLLITTLVLLPFSYYPLVSFGQLEGVHVDGSLLYAVVLLATLCSLPLIWQRRQHLFQAKPFLLLVLFVIYCAASSVWSDNPFRSIVTVTFFALMIALASGVIVQWRTITQYSRPVLIAAASAVTLSIVWSLWQIFGEAFGVSGSLTLLPPDYRSAVFGVARPTGFALEPQFFASILLIPLLWLTWQYLTKTNRTKKASILLPVALVATSSTLLLTLSRGGIYAAILGLVILLVLEYRHLRRWLSLAVYLLLSIAISATITFSAASINQRDTINGQVSLSKALNHLSLGILSLPTSSEPQPAISRASVGRSTTQTNKEGYVASSTESRTSMSHQAISLWAQNPQTILLGVGIGSFGATLHATNDAFPVGSVVNNYYLELLAETGIIGSGLFAAFAISLIYYLFKRRQYFLAALLISLFAQLCFFSGNANIIHLWVIVGIAIASLLPQPKSKRRLVQ